MRRNKLFLFLSSAMLVSFVLTSFATIYAEDGKMPITTSSEKALMAYHEGLRFLDRSQPESARPLFEEAVKLDPNFIMAYDALRRSAPNFKVGREYFAKVQDLAANTQISDGEKLFFEGLFAAFNGDRETNSKNLEMLAEKYPMDERILYQLALSNFGTDDEKVVKILTKAEKVNPDFIPLYNIKGYSLRALGEFSEAEMAFKKAIALDSENPNAYDSYAELLLKLGRYDESIANYDKALEREPLFPSAQIGIASNLLLLNQHKSARTRLNSLMSIAPHDGIRSGIHWALAVTHADEGNLEKALQELEKNYVISKKINDTSAMTIDLRNMAAVLIEMGKLDKAEETYQKSVDIIQNDPKQNDRFKAFSKVFALYGQGVIAAKKMEFSTAETKAEALNEMVTSLNSPPFFARLVHELNGIIALEHGDYDHALMELHKADATEAYNMYRMALALEAKGNHGQAHKQLSNVVNYNSALNFNFSFIRQKAAQKLEKTGS